jgi:hypothetical protein
MTMTLVHCFFFEGVTFRELLVVWLRLPRGADHYGRAYFSSFFSFWPCALVMSFGHLVGAEALPSLYQKKPGC